MKRIMVIGICGAGKTALAKNLHERTGLPLFHLDQLYWKSGWIESTRDEFERRLSNLVAGERWIIDGNYSSTFNVRMLRADAIVYLDFSRSIAIYRALQRTVLSYGRVRDDMAPGCPEGFDLGFLKYIWNFHRHHRPRAEAALAQARDGQRIFRLKSPADVAGFLKSFPT